MGPSIKHGVKSGMEWSPAGLEVIKLFSMFNSAVVEHA